MIRQRSSIACICVTLLLAASAACTDAEKRAADMAAQAQQLFDSGQPGPAFELIGRSIRERDDLPAPYLLQGRIALALGKSGDAYRAYANALALDAANPEALIGVAQTGLSVGRLDEADSAADKILVLNPNQTDAMLIKGIVRMVHNDLDGAITFGDRVLALKRDDVAAIILKSRALALRGDRAAALTLVRSGITKVGETRELAMSLAELQRFNGDAEAFLSSLRRIRELVPQNRDYRFDLVDTLYRLGHTDEARNEAASLIAEPTLNADEASRLTRLWYAYDRDALTAEQVAEVATKASVETRLTLARYYIAAGHADVAAALLRPLATGWSSDIQALYARAIGATGNVTAAHIAATGILERDPGNGDALLIRADAAMARRDPANAVIDYQRVIRDYPVWEEGYLGLARAYAASDKQSGVRRAFEDARKAMPQSLPIARAYTETLLQIGDTGHALEVARRFALDSPSLLAGWSLYAATCGKTIDRDCRSEAADGAKQARTRYGLDPAPGTPPPVTLIGRLT
jgi:tetratricopeptide (TPR) repeat protein